MPNLNFYINNILAPPPENAQDLWVELSFENDSPDASVRTTTFQWLGENATTINQWITGGLNGAAPGLFEGIAFRIEVCDPNLIVFDGCVDFTTKDSTFTCDIIRAGAQQTGQIDDLSHKAQGFNFSNLRRLPVNSPGRILTSDYIKIPYVISRLPDYEQVAILGVSFVEMVRILRDTFTQTQILINDLTGMTANVPPTPVQVALKILSIIFYVIYMLFLILMLVRLFLLIVNNIIQPIKYKFGMKAKTLFERACQYLGLQFSSTIFDNNSVYRNLVILPVKTSSLQAATFTDIFFGNTTSRKTYDDSLNLNAPVPSRGYPEGSFYEFIQWMKDLCNAKCSIRNNTLYFERWDNFTLQSGVTLPPVSTEAPFENPYGTNASELSANYFFKHQYDTTDVNTLDAPDGRVCQARFTPVIVQNANNILLRNLKYVNSAFALGVRKTSLTYPEKLMGFLGNAINAFLAPVVAIINTVNNVTNSNIQPPTINTNLFGTRIGALLLSNDYTSVKKILIVNDPDARGVSFLSPLNQSLTSATAFQNNFHSASWMYDASGNAPNQYLTYKKNEIPLCCSDFVKIKDNNFVTTYDQKPARIDSLKWNPWNEIALVDYRVKQKWTNNLQLTLVSDAE